MISVKHQLLAAFCVSLCVCVHTWMQHCSLQFVSVLESCEMPLIPPAAMATVGTGWLCQCLSTTQDHISEEGLCIPIFVH